MEEMIYLGTLPCGCAPVAVVDSESHKDATARDVARMVRDGMTVERVTREEYLRRFGFCAQHEAERTAKRVAPRAKHGTLTMTTRSGKPLG